MNTAPRVKNQTVQSPDGNGGSAFRDSKVEEIQLLSIEVSSHPDICAALALPGNQRPGASRGQSVKAEKTKTEKDEDRGKKGEGKRK